MSGDRGAEAFDRLYTEHAAGLLAFLTYQTGDRALAEDIVADSFERVLTARSGWRGHSGQKTWLYAIAMNRLRDLARRRGAESRAIERVAVNTGFAYDEIDAVGDRDMLQRALQTLSEEERAVVALRFGADLTLGEIAEVLEERQSTVEGRLYRALRRLRDATT
jgi:RNA polymerase sigma-70 factor (ECF subfamily)